MEVINFIWNAIIGWIELLDKVPIINDFSALDLLLSISLFCIILKLFFLKRSGE